MWDRWVLFLSFFPCLLKNYLIGCGGEARGKETSRQVKKRWRAGELQSSPGRRRRRTWTSTPWTARWRWATWRRWCTSLHSMMSSIELTCSWGSPSTNLLIVYIHVKIAFWWKFCYSSIRISNLESRRRNNCTYLSIFNDETVPGLQIRLANLCMRWRVPCSSRRMQSLSKARPLSSRNSSTMASTPFFTRLDNSSTSFIKIPPLLYPDGSWI